MLAIVRHLEAFSTVTVYFCKLAPGLTFPYLTVGFKTARSALRINAVTVSVADRSDT